MKRGKMTFDETQLASFLRDELLKSSEVKNYLIRGAVRDNNLSYPNRQWGFGKLSIQGIFDSLAGL